MPQPRNGPLFTESTVELYRRAREQRGKPAPPDARAIGALYELILSIHAADSLWRAAATRTEDLAWRGALEKEREASRRHAYQAATVIRELGGAPPEMRDQSELPHDVRDIEYAADDDTVRRYLDEVRELLERQVLRVHDELAAVTASH